MTYGPFKLLLSNHMHLKLSLKDLFLISNAYWFFYKLLWNKWLTSLCISHNTFSFWKKEKRQMYFFQLLLVLQHNHTLFYDHELYFTVNWFSLISVEKPWTDWHKWCALCVLMYFLHQWHRTASAPARSTLCTQPAVLTLLLLNTSFLANSVEPDQLASSEANWSGSVLFVIKYVNFFQKPSSSNLIGWNGHGILIYSAWEGLKHIRTYYRQVW